MLLSLISFIDRLPLPELSKRPKAELQSWVNQLKSNRLYIDTLIEKLERVIENKR